MPITITTSGTISTSITSISNNGAGSVFSGGFEPVTTISPVVVGTRGDDGDNVSQLEPRIAALEDQTDGEVNGITPRAQFLLTLNN